MITLKECFIALQQEPMEIWAKDQRLLIARYITEDRHQPKCDFKLDKQLDLETFLLKLKGLFGELPPYPSEQLVAMQEEIAAIIIPNEEEIIKNCELLDMEMNGYLSSKDFSTVMITAVSLSDEHLDLIV